MANEEHLKILQQGVEVWDQETKDNHYRITQICDSKTTFNLPIFYLSKGVEYYCLR
jgi:hypothetical protein